MKSPPSATLRNVLLALFFIAMIAATGPGVLLVNRPEMIVGIPLVYAWAIGWYFVLVAIALVAYCKLWTADDSSEDGPGASS
jgi:hypothetical protein